VSCKSLQSKDEHNPNFATIKLRNIMNKKKEKKKSISKS